MQQVVSDRHTMLIQFGLSMLVALAIIYSAYATGFTANYTGMLGIIELLVWNGLSVFIAMNIVGVFMYGLNLLFYRIQVYRHGSPTENIIDD